MMFWELLRSTRLPSTAKYHLSQTLSQKTKGSLMHQADGKRILVDAIEEIDRSSVEKIETLI